MVAAPTGTTWTNAGGKLTANLPKGKNYMSVAILPDNTEAAFNLYSQYAFNFITNTTVEWEYLQNASKVATRYNVETINMETKAVGGDTIMALYPHQWRYCDTDYTGYTYDTIRGTMKTIVGSSYITEMTYSGILTGLPMTKDEEQLGRIKAQLGYLYDYRSNLPDPKWICNLEGQYGGYDTYWIGKNLNTMTDAIILADQFSDDQEFAQMRDDMVNGMESYLEFWFDPYQAYINGNTVDDYFYYDSNYGTLVGYPASYSSDLEMNDHHFHYGYWIKTAAVLAMQDPEWASEWGGMVYEMISDIANTNRDGSSYNDNSPAKYPFLRNFDIYEGHSWASGVANYEYDKDGNMIDPNGGLSGGNNQESSSESVNAWASLIMWGDAMNDTRIRDLGIYLYTTEIAAIEDYYFDVHNEIFTDEYEDRDNYDIQSVTRLFGGRYDHTAWWTENSIEVSTILMLPVNGASLYLGKYPQKVKNLYDSIKPSSRQWKNFVNNKEQICKNYGKQDMLVGEQTNQEIVCEYYAFYDPQAALDKYIISDDYHIENGESRAHTIQYITSLGAYGNQNFDVTASWPTALVMEKNGVKTYVAQNHTDNAIRVYYSDGAYVDVAANTDYAGPKSGTGENPNIDEGTISGSKQKFTLEVHKEKYDGSGYDVSTRTVSVKSDNDMYTYFPTEIEGFTFDSTNSNNVLTINVAEGNLNTAVVYYKRNTYSIQYVLDGATASGNPNSYKYGSEITFNTPSKKGYVFEGWYLDNNYTIPFEGITSTTSGNLKVYAKMMDATLITTYKVEYWIMSDNREFYSLADDQTEVITSYVGTKVAAVDKAYSGYILNDNSTVSGVVLPDDQLVLRMYYDIPAPDKTGDMSSGHGIMVDKDNKVTIYAADMKVQVLYYKTFADKSSAELLYNQVINGQFGGFPGYNPVVADGVYTYQIGAMTDAQYIVFAYNDGTGIREITMKNIGDAKKEAAENATKKAGYVVKYFRQNSNLTGYSEVTSDSATLEGEVSSAVVAPVKKYDGFVVNEELSNLTGTVVDDGSLVLNIYYDVARTTVSKNKYTLETYKEKLDGSGYEMTYKVVSVDTQNNTFTYSPIEIEGFVFDASNANNNLTVDVSEGNIETVKVYYNRAVYNISYILDGGKTTNRKTYKYGQSVELTDATKNGFVFEGWYLDREYKNQIKVINENEAGDFVLYAKFVDENDISGYKVEHYKMTQDGQAYELAHTDVISDSLVGLTVEATAKKYNGYVLSEKSVVTGTVLPQDKLVIRLYYDVDIISLASPVAGAKLDASGNVVLYTKKTNNGQYLVYCSEFGSKSEAQRIYDEKCISHSPAGMPGYLMEDKGDTFETNIGKKDSGKYIVFIFNRGKGSEAEKDCYMIKVSDIANANTEPVKANYKVNYYVQNESGDYEPDHSANYEAYAGYVAFAPEMITGTYYLNKEISTLFGV
ncbi:MAG: InlB B-repeat-containing protein, partial [Lachnospiraceae bacterium]|nr:InlB B-repeat-containing protein [Lachnospiraceae bacterium]